MSAAPAVLVRFPCGPESAAEPTLFYPTTLATDRRLVLPWELVIKLSLDLDTAEKLADQVSAYVAEILCRSPWRETLLERRAGPGGTLLPLSRWPIEGESPTGSLPEDPPAVTVVGGAAVDLEDYWVTGVGRSALYRADEWPWGSDFEATYTAGYLAPGQLGHIDAAEDPDLHVETWAASTVYGDPGSSHAYAGTTGSWVRPTRPDGAVYELTASSGDKTSDSDEPDWSAAIGATTLDGDADQLTWTAHPDCILLPERARQAAMALARKINAANNGQACPADCAEAEAMIRTAFGEGC